MRRLSVVLCLFLAACAAPTSGEYQRGAPVPVRPPPAPLQPGVGAPVVGQPGQVRAPLPRSPHQRVLPPSKEPGLWSGDEPRAARPTPPKLEPVIAGITLPYIENATEEERELTLKCAFTMSNALGPAPANMTEEQRACLAARLYKHCAASVLSRMEAKRPLPAFVKPKSVKVARRWLKTATDFEVQKCTPSLMAQSGGYFAASTGWDIMLEMGAR